MKAHICYHCKQWIEAGEPHDCWTTTEQALTADLSEDLRDAWERLRESALEFGEQRIYASHHSIMAFVVAQRRKELGIRLALGASPGVLIWLVMREVLLLLALGLAIGVPAALGLGHYVASQLYGLQAHDPLIATSTVALLTLVSAAAGLIPAQRAGAVDPMLALRTE